MPGIDIKAIYWPRFQDIGIYAKTERFWLKISPRSILITARFA